MKKRDVTLGQVYAVKVSGAIQKVRVVAESPYGGWVGKNLATGREVRIRTAGRLRYPVDPSSKLFCGERPAITVLPGKGTFGEQPA
jgi:hypothetical protein